jgi:hypothetical protein
MSIELNGTAAAQSGLLRKSWRAFNRWRKRYLWIRLLFLLLFGAYVCREAFFPVTPRLHRFYTEQLFAEYEPGVVDALARSRKVRLARQLQVALGRTADRDGDGVLSEDESNSLRDFALQPEEIWKKSVHADLARLMAACHRAGLLPKSYTLRVARGEARFAAVAEVENLNRPAREEIDEFLKVWEMPDYSRLETWKRGVMLFFRWLEIPVLTLGRPRTVVVWLLFCFFLSLTVTAHARTKRFAKGLLVGAGVSLPLVPDIIVWIAIVVRPLAAVVYALYGWTFEVMHSTALVALGLSLLLLGTLLGTGYLRNAGLVKRILAVVPLLVTGWMYLFAFRVGRSALLGPAIGFPCLSMAFAGFAGRIASGGHNSYRLFSVGMLGLGIVLLAWTAARGLSGPRSPLGWFPNDAVLAIHPPGVLFEPDYPVQATWDWLPWVWVPRWMSWVALPLGAACLIAGLAASPTVARLRRRRGTHRSSEVEADDKPREK